MDIRKKINEAKSVEVYKALLTILGDFTEKYPASSVDRLLDIMIEKGSGILPKDKRALDILAYAGFCEGVSNLLNMRIADLPVELRPISKAGLRHETAFWGRGDQIYDKVKDLINFDGKGGEKWCDADGKKVTLLNTTANEGKVKEGRRVTVEEMAGVWDDSGLEKVLDMFDPGNIVDPYLKGTYAKAQKACEALKKMLRPHMDKGEEY